MKYREYLQMLEDRKTKGQRCVWRKCVRKKRGLFGGYEDVTECGHWTCNPYYNSCRMQRGYECRYWADEDTEIDENAIPIETEESQ